jgi:hypothetical protein
MKIKSEDKKKLKISASGFYSEESKPLMPPIQFVGNKEIISYAKSEVWKTTMVVRKWLSKSN